MNDQLREELLRKYLSGECSNEEQLRVEAWLEQMEATDNKWERMDAPAKAAWMASLFGDIRQTINTREMPDEHLAPIRSIFGRTLYRVAVAAAVLVIIGASVYWWLIRTPETEMAGHGKKPGVAQDVAPGGNKAILTLGDNSTIVLDSAANGQLAKQGSSVVKKTKDGELRYESTIGNRDLATTYNILTTPRGGQYQLVLPDGSKVWLNAASSIRYPTAFTKNERSVDITGEVYFEVAPIRLPSGQRKPFRVQFISAGREGAVEVLGTHFNINTYDDEPAMKTTLLEGSVKVTTGASSALLKPGEQISIYQSSHLSKPMPVQVAEVVAWKNGLFKFTNADLPTVMRQLVRWYNVDIIYEQGVPSLHFGGEISSSSNLSQVLQVLQISGVNARIEDRKIIISK